MAGAERLSERIAQTFEDHFGIRPLEGYGSTEGLTSDSREYL